MSTVARRTRSRQTLSGSDMSFSYSDAQSRHRNHHQPPRNPPVIDLINGDNEQVRNPSRSESPLSSDLVSDSSERQGAVEGGDQSISAGASSIEVKLDAEEFLDDPIEEESGTEGSSGSSVRFEEVEVDEIEVIEIEDAGDDGDGEEEAAKAEFGWWNKRLTRLQAGEQSRVSYTKYFRRLRADEFEEKEKKDMYEGEETGGDNVGHIEGEDAALVMKKKKKKKKKKKNRSEAAGSSGNIGVAQRCQSQFNSGSDKKTKKMRKMRTGGNPACSDVDDLDTSSDDYEDEVNTDGTENEVFYQGSKKRKQGRPKKPVDDDDDDDDDDDVEEEMESVDDEDVDDFAEEEDEENAGERETNGLGKRIRSSSGVKLARRNEERGDISRKRKGDRSMKDEYFRVIADTILNDDKELPVEFVEEWPTAKGGSGWHDEELFTLVFSSDEDSEPKKTEHEKELDELWTDFDFALDSENIGALHDDEVETDELYAQDDESHPSILCCNGKHQFILNEQIGFRCKFCTFVELEIKDIFPSWVFHTGERFSEKRTVDKVLPLLFNDLSTEGKSQDSHGFSRVTTVWDLIPGTQEKMFMHQREAFEFLWRNLAGSIELDELKSCSGCDGTGGCVISHAPGTGKTRLAIVFIQSYMKLFPECRPVIVAHRGLLQTWSNEIKKWGVDLCVHNLNSDEFSGEEDPAHLQLAKKVHGDRNFMRLVKLSSWVKGNSVLLVTYNLLVIICSTGDSLRCALLKAILLEKPNLIIFDEGHTPRNERSLMVKTLGKIKTSKRVILSGTLFQNNFTELYNTLCLVRPKFAEKISTKTSKLYQQRKVELFSGREDNIFSERNQAKSKWDHLTKCVNDDSSQELEVVKSVIKPFVHVHTGSILETLPGFRKCVLHLDPSPQQKHILEKLQDMRLTSSFDTDFKFSLVSVHPSLVMAFLSEEEQSVIDTSVIENLRLNPLEGVKTKFVLELLRLCEALKEKVLVFCQFKEPLKLITEQLVKSFGWREGKQILKINGTSDSLQRQSSIDAFNDLASEARVLLASTKACCEGISLVGASRVVLLDVLWNPSVEHQAISRAYRIGQQKFVYIYQLITFGTAERDKCSKQYEKDHMAKLVFSPETDMNDLKASSSHAEEERMHKLAADDKILEAMNGNAKIKDMFLKIEYP